MLLAAEASLVKGFVLEAQGDQDGALSAWKRGFALCRDARKTRRLTTMADFPVYQLGSLSGNLDREAVDQMFADVVATGLPVAKELAGYLRPIIENGKILDAEIVPAMREVWRRPRGHAYARQIAWHQTSCYDAISIEVPLIIYEVVRLGAFAGEMTVDQDALVWQMATDARDMWQKGELELNVVTAGGLGGAWGGAAWRKFGRASLSFRRRFATVLNTFWGIDTESSAMSRSRQSSSRLPGTARSRL